MRQGEFCMSEKTKKDIYDDIVLGLLMLAIGFVAIAIGFSNKFVDLMLFILEISLWLVCAYLTIGGFYLFVESLIKLIEIKGRKSDGQ